MADEKNLEGKIIKVQQVDYRIAEKIGLGGFGEVWRAEAAPGKVAVKILLPEHYQNGGVDRFIQEGNLTKKLQHEHIIHTYEVGKDNQLGPYIVTEYLEGGSLNQYLQHGGIDTARARQIIKDVAEALDFAHGNKILHRDVHPGNILFDKKGRVVLTDFGLAAVMKSSPLYGSITSYVSQSHPAATVSVDEALKQIFPAMARSGGKNTQLAEMVRSLWIGTKEYAAPEIFRSGKGIEAATEQSDQFSLAKVAYALFGVIGEKRLQQVVGQALYDNPEQRFKAMKEFIAAIQAVPDYLSLLRQKKGIASGKPFSKAELEEVCTLGEQGYKEEPTNKDALQEVLEQIRSAQHDAYSALATEAEKILKREGKSISTQKRGEVRAMIMPIKTDILPLYNKIKMLVGEK